MEAIRQVWDIESDKLTINIPKQFRRKKVEVIILPIEQSENKENMDHVDETTDGDENQLSREAIEFLSLGGSGCWEGNLDEMREKRNGID